MRPRLKDIARYENAFVLEADLLLVWHEGIHSRAPTTTFDAHSDCWRLPPRKGDEPEVGAPEWEDRRGQVMVRDI